MDQVSTIPSCRDGAPIKTTNNPSLPRKVTILHPKHGLVMWVLQFQRLYEEPNHSQQKIKSL
jgi:hypothetical protein